MGQKDISIRPANNSYEEGIAFSRFMDMASEGGLRKALGGRFEDIIATAFCVPNHDFSFSHAFFAEHGGKIVGMAAGYNSDQHHETTNRPLKRAPGSRLRRTIGLVLLGFFSRIVGKLEDKAYYIHFLAVDDSFRGRGIGTMLLTHMEQQAKSSGCFRLSIDVSAKNPGARRLYKRYGFEEVSEWPTWPLVPRALYRLDKVIP